MFSISESTAQVFKCKSSSGTWTYTSSPCSSGDESESVKLKSPTNKGAQSGKSLESPLIGNWKSGIHTYEFRSDGSLRDEQSYNGELIVWRRGSWLYEDEILKLRYTESGGPLGGGSMNHSESGKVEWFDLKKSFEIRLNRRIVYFVRLE